MVGRDDTADEDAGRRCGGRQGVTPFQFSSYLQWRSADTWLMWLAG